MTATQNKSKGNRKKIRFPGIMRDAVLLQVERTHLYRVLTGEKIIPTLLARYRKLKRSQSAVRAALSKSSEISHETTT
jgi:hypothetical protein